MKHIVMYRNTIGVLDQLTGVVDWTDNYKQAREYRHVYVGIGSLCVYGKRTGVIKDVLKEAVTVNWCDGSEIDLCAPPMIALPACLPYEEMCEALAKVIPATPMGITTLSVDGVPGITVGQDENHKIVSLFVDGQVRKW